LGTHYTHWECSHRNLNLASSKFLIYLKSTLIFYQSLKNNLLKTRDQFKLPNQLDNRPPSQNEMKTERKLLSALYTHSKANRLIWPVTWLICMTTNNNLLAKRPENVSIKSVVNKGRAKEMELELLKLILGKQLYEELLEKRKRVKKTKENKNKLEL